MPSPILTLLDYTERILDDLKTAIQKRSLRETRHAFDMLTAFSECLKESLPLGFVEPVFDDFDRHMWFIGHFLKKKNFKMIESNFADIVESDTPEIRRQINDFVESGKWPEDDSIPLSEDIFIVHGRDHKPLKELKTLLEDFGLNPIVLHEEPSGSRTIVEKLERYSDVGFTFVILTPDDIGSSSDAPFTSPRARQNVVLEFGYFMGMLSRDRVCCLYKGQVELPSDMHGVVYIPFEESINEVRDKIIRELEEAGYEIGKYD